MTLTESPASLDVEAFCTDTAFADAAPPWRALFSSLNETPFLSPQWHDAWWRHLASGAPEVLVARRDDDVVGVAPLVRTGGRLAFSGGDLTDILDVLAVDDDATRALARAAAARAESLELRFVPEGGRALGAFADELRRAGFAVAVEPIVVSPRAALRSSFEQQLEGLTKKDRHELRRKLRRLESAGAVEFGYASSDQLDSALDRFVTWHQGTPGEKGAFLTPEREAFFRAIARAGNDAGWLRLGELRLDGRPIGALFAFEHARTLAAYNSAVDPDRVSLSPGILLHALAMRDAIARGLETYDMLRGGEPYKYDLGATDLQLYRLEARKP